MTALVAMATTDAMGAKQTAGTLVNDDSAASGDLASSSEEPSLTDNEDSGDSFQLRENQLLTDVDTDDEIMPGDGQMSESTFKTLPMKTDARCFANGALDDDIGEFLLDCWRSHRIGTGSWRKGMCLNKSNEV